MKRAYFTVSAVSITAMMVVSLASPTEILIWNRTPSAPIGLYLLTDKSPAKGDWVAVSSAAPSSKWIAANGFLAPDWPIIKRVAGAPGDQICRDGETILINKTRKAAALLSDSSGGKLPLWQGCFVLEPGEYFLLNDHPRSLDGRYFGKTTEKDIAGTAALLWRKTP